MTINKADTFLAHYGVLGMHWGVRKLQPTRVKTHKTPPSEDHATAQALKKKKLHEMSNAEVKTLTNRLQLETSYRKLTGENVTKLDRGQKEADRIMKLGGTVVAAYALYNSPVGKAVGAAIKNLVIKGNIAYFA